MYSQGELKKMVNKAIVNLVFNDESEKLNAPIRYILSVGGKRLRPVLALMCCNLYTDKIDHAIIPVTGLEIFHNFTLVHDDIMDNASIRRSQPTVHVKWNTSQAILSGDVMAFIANECFLQSDPGSIKKVFRAYNKAAIEVCVGQQLDMDFERTKVVSQDDYLRMIELKTAVLIAASAKIGALLGNADDKEARLLYEFGRNLGLAFQIQDDLLDVYGDKDIFGKKSGGDIVSNKKTILLVKALEKASSEERKKLIDLFQVNDIDPEEKIKAVTDLYEHLNVRPVTESLAFDYINASLSYLDRVDVDKDRKEELYQMALSLSGRDK